MSDIILYRIRHDWLGYVPPSTNKEGYTLKNEAGLFTLSQACGWIESRSEFARRHYKLEPVAMSEKKGA